MYTLTRKKGKRLWRIKRLTVNKESFQIRAAHILYHCHICTPTFNWYKNIIHHLSFSQITRRHDPIWTAGNPFDSLTHFFRVMSNSSSASFAREWRFARWMLSSGVLKQHCQNYMSAPACFLRLRLLKRLYRITASPTRTSNKMSEFSKVGLKLFGVPFLSRNSFLVKLTRKT